MMVQDSPQMVKDTEALMKETRSKAKANPLVITLKNPSVDIVGEGSSGPRSEDASSFAQTGLSSKAQILQDAEYHNRQRFLALEAEFDKAFKHAADTGNLALYMSQQLGITEFEFNFHNVGEDGVPNPRLTEANELLRLIREDHFNLGVPEMKTYSESTGIK